MADLHIPVSALGAKEVNEDSAKLAALIACAESFREFLNYWHFRDQETGEIRILGEVLWAGQEEFAHEVATTPALYALKARKLGYTTIECAYDGWVARFRDKNGRVHCFSRREKAAQGILAQVKFGLDKLPEYMRLPYKHANSNEFCLDAGKDATGMEDTRFVVAYPADEDTAVEDTCTHGHVDEWARMGNPRRVWQAIEPSMAKTCHIITTGLGPGNYSSEFWRKAMAGDAVVGKHRHAVKPFFQHALKRESRDQAWLDAKKRSMDEISFRQEYPMTWQDALYGGGDYMFRGADLEVAQEGALGPTLPRPGRKYIKAWDIGRHHDAAVGVVLDVTDQVVDVVDYRRYRRLPYPDLQQIIEAVHATYEGFTVIEKNGPGEAVAENLELPPHEVILFVTSKPSKARILAGLAEGFQSQVLRYSATAWPQLHAELSEYQLPDDDLVQDSVMSLGIGYEHAGLAHIRGRARVVQL